MPSASLQLIYVFLRFIFFAEWLPSRGYRYIWKTSSTCGSTMRELSLCHGPHQTGTSASFCSLLHLGAGSIRASCGPTCSLLGWLIYPGTPQAFQTLILLMILQKVDLLYISLIILLESPALIVGVYSGLSWKLMNVEDGGTSASTYWYLGGDLNSRCCFPSNISDTDLSIFYFNCLNKM